MKWSKEEKEKIIYLLKNGETYSNISKIFNVSPNTIRTVLYHEGLKYTDFISKIDISITKKCITCENTFESKKCDNRKFCSHSCSAKYSNSSRTINKKERIENCLNCDKKLKSKNAQYCSNTCFSNYRTNEINKKIKEGDISFYEKRYKRYLIDNFGNKCMKCNWCEINETTGNIPIQLHHIDGNYKNNNLNNLILLCPNCHSLTSTYGFLNKGNGREKRYIK